MDGATRWQKFKTVTLPFLRPAMLPYAIYGFVITFNLFYLSYFMSGGGPFGRTELFVTEAYGSSTSTSLRRRGRLLRADVLPAAGHHARHEPHGEGDGELCRLSAARTHGAAGRAARERPMSPATQPAPASARRVHVATRRRSAAAARAADRSSSSSASSSPFTVLFPIMWIFSMSHRPAEPARPDSLHPARARRSTPTAGARPADQQRRSASSSWRLNSFMLAVEHRAVLACCIGVLAAYAFSRLQFRGRES